MKTYLSAILAGIVACTTSVAWAETVELPLTDDAFVNAIKPDLRTGTWERIVVHTYGPKHGLVRFDAASIAGQEVSEATLTLYVDSLALNGTMSVHAVTSGWSEATVTWNNQPPAETMATAIVGLTTGDVGSVITIDVTAAVQRWADGSLADAGFLMVTTEDIRAKFDAKEMAGGVAATLTVETGEPVFTGEAIVLDLSNPDTCLIDESGYYILDRSWRIGSSSASIACSDDQIVVSANATIDLKGFELEASIAVEHSAVIRNGTLIKDTSSAISSTQGATLRLENIATFGSVGIASGTVVNSHIRGGVAIFRGSVINSLMAECGGTCIRIPVAEYSDEGGNVVITNNQIEGPVNIRCGWMEDSCAMIRGNTIRIGEDIADDHPVAIFVGRGSSGPPIRNIIAHNIITMTHPGATGIWVEAGVAALVDGNVIIGGIRGITFWDEDDCSYGNCIGNNRVSSQYPYTCLSHTRDWGGNVSF
jgi:hypothetical protein